MSRRRNERATSTRTESAQATSPRFRAYIAQSLDGFIADQDGGVGWLDPYFSPELGFHVFLKTIGASG